MDDPKKFDQAAVHTYSGDWHRRSDLDVVSPSPDTCHPERERDVKRLLHFDRISREDRDMREGMLLPADPSARKNIPLTSGVLDYFPLALAYVARISKAGNDQHNPGKRLHWARGKSTDHADCIPRHLIDRGTYDSDGLSHTGKLAWRALALLQEELEREISAGNDPFKRST